MLVLFYSKCINDLNLDCLYSNCAIVKIQKMLVVK